MTSRSKRIDLGIAWRKKSRSLQESAEMGGLGPQPDGASGLQTIIADVAQV